MKKLLFFLSFTFVFSSTFLFSREDLVKKELIGSEKIFKTYHTKIGNTETFDFFGKWEKNDRIILSYDYGVEVFYLKLVFQDQNGYYYAEDVFLSNKVLGLRKTYKETTVLLGPSSIPEGQRKVKNLHRQNLVHVQIKLRVNVKYTDDFLHSQATDPLYAKFKLYAARSKAYDDFLLFTEQINRAPLKSLKKYLPRDSNKLMEYLKRAVYDYDLFHFDTVFFFLDEAKKRFRNDLARKKNLEILGEKLFTSFVQERFERDAKDKTIKLSKLGFKPGIEAFYLTFDEKKASFFDLLLSLPHSSSLYKHFNHIKRDQETEEKIIHKENILHIAVRHNWTNMARVILKHLPNFALEKDKVSSKAHFHTQSATAEQRLKKHWRDKAYKEMREIFKEFNRKQKKMRKARP